MDLLNAFGGRQFAAICLLVISCGIPAPDGAIAAPNSIAVNVEGIGETVEAARKNAFDAAIKEVAGSLVMTVREISNDQLDEWSASYSKGIIEKSTVLDLYVDKQGLTRVKMLVFVSRSKIREKVAATTDARAVSGGKFAAAVQDLQDRIDSEKNSAAEARKVVDRLIHDLPHALFEIRAGEFSVKREGDSIKSSLNYSIRINNEFLSNLCEWGDEYITFIKDPTIEGYPKLIYVSTKSMFSIFSTTCRGTIFITEDQNNYLLEELRDLGIITNFLDSEKRPVSFIRTYSFVEFGSFNEETKFFEAGIYLAGNGMRIYSDGGEWNDQQFSYDLGSLPVDDIRKTGSIVMSIFGRHDEIFKR